MLNPNVNKYNIQYQEYKRYARQLIIKNIALEGQKRIHAAHILCIGAGGLNTPVLLYLAACGIGTIGIIDHDNIELSNLQRQILYKNNDVHQLKTRTAYSALKSLNPLINIRIYQKKLDLNNINFILAPYDIIIDGTDNLYTRYILSQYCYQLHKIHIYGAIEQFIGHISVFNYKNGINYYNLYNNITKNYLNKCNNVGIVNTLAGIVGMLQATETIKITIGIGSITNGYLLIFNILHCSLNKTRIKSNRITAQVVSSLILNQFKFGNKYINFQTLYNNFFQSYQIIDIRTPSEFHFHKIHNSLNIPFEILKKNTWINYIKKLKKDTIIIYCNNKIRSYLASKILTKYSINNYILISTCNNP